MTGVRLFAAVAAAAVLALTGCAATQPRPAATTPSATPTLSRLQACQQLRKNMLANGGTADAATLNRLAALTQDQFSVDAQQAAKDVGTDMAQFDAAGLAHDCDAVGVQIPY